MLIETHNAQMIREGKTKEERFRILKEIADYQISILSAADSIVRIQEDINAWGLFALYVIFITVYVIDMLKVLC